MPEWELKLWRAAFDVFGPLDWKREDLLVARVNQYQAATTAPLKDFILFRDVTDKAEKKTERDVLKAFGFMGE